MESPILQVLGAQKVTCMKYMLPQAVNKTLGFECYYIYIEQLFPNQADLRPDIFHLRNIVEKSSLP